MQKLIQTRLIIYPDFKDSIQTCDVLNRISWGLHGIAGGTISLFLPVESASASVQLSDWFNKPVLPEFVEHHFSELPPIIRHIGDLKMELGDFCVFWDASKYLSRFPELGIEKKIIIDPNFQFNHEADQIAALQYTISSAEHRKTLWDTSRSRYSEFLKCWKGVENAYIYLTGPTIETTLTLPIERSSLHIICNSLVKNTELLQKIQPDVLMFSDPAYHFGISRYAASFRAYVNQAMADFQNMLCMVPERYYPLTVAFLDEKASERIIGIPLVEMNDFNFPSIEKFYIRKTANVLTSMMIPVASSVAARICILGADGRASSDKGYWCHPKSSQINDQLRTIYESHPSLARDENVEKYYLEHCQLLEAQLVYGETTQKKDYACLTPSMIPALANRMPRS